MDLNKCLEILNNRPACEEHDHEHHKTENGNDPGNSRPIGQVIDLLPPAAPEAAGINKGFSNGLSASEQESPEVRAQRSVKKLQEEGLKDMDAKSLIDVFRKAQEERTLAYRTFDEGLGQIIRTGKLTDYDAICAEATASFAALSNLANAIITSLNGPQHDQGVLAELLRKVQSEEKQKLSLTAALHLEKVRLHQVSSLGDAGGEGNGQIGREVQLLTLGVKSLESRIGAAVIRINDVLEEIRYEVAEL